MIGELTFLVERLETVARALIGSWPGGAETQLRASCFHSRHELAPGTWIRVLMPTLTEIGVRPNRAERYEQILELGGRSFAELPPNASVTVVANLRGQGLLRRYLVTRTARLFESPAIAALPLGEYRKQFENAIAASDDHCCATTLEQARARRANSLGTAETSRFFSPSLARRRGGAERFSALMRICLRPSGLSAT